MFDGLSHAVLEQQMDCLAEAIYYEARGESFAGQVFVGFVIRNRVLSDRFPDTFCQVIEQPHQFSFYDHIDNKQKAMREVDARDQAYEVAYMVMNTSTPPIPEGVMFYHTTNILPNWNYSLLDEYAVVGNHIFYQRR